MNSRHARSALLVSLTIVGLFGCKNEQLCKPLGACGGDLLAGAVDFAKKDGLIDRSWTVTQASEGACQDQLQLPPTNISLARQPPNLSTQRPNDPATADWCGNLVLKSTGEVKEFIVYAPPLPLKVAELTVSADFDGNKDRGTYVMQTTIDQTRDLVFSESCITAQGIRLSCPTLGRRLGEFLAAEANIYNMRCQDPDDKTQGGCVCKFDLSFIGGQTGRWAKQNGGTQIQFFENVSYSPAALADYCVLPDASQPGGVGALDLTGSNETPLFNQKGLRTLHMTPPSCNDGVQSLELGEEGIDCGGGCPTKCGTCTNHVHDANEEGIDCGGACLGILCDETVADPNQKPAACANKKQDPWEEGIDCGGPCPTECNP